MLGKKARKFVYMVTHRSEKGFTLLSMLVVTVIIFTTLPLLAYLVNAVTYHSNYDEINIQQFLYFLRDEFMLATDYSVTKNKVVFHELNYKNVSFERLSNIIVRRVNGTGYDIYLRGLQDLQFTDLSYGIHVEITSLEGKIYEKTIVHYE